MKIEFNEKVVVITGASGGIGSAMAKAFAENGAVVCVCDLKNTDKTVGEITAAGHLAAGYDFDITDRKATNEVMKSIAEKYGKIDILINNAGINVGPDERNTIENFSDKWFDGIISVDLIGTYNCSKAAIPFMTGKGANIINISSITGMVPLRDQCAFTAAKAGVINMTRAMALELAPKGIRVNSVAPGTIGIAVTNELWKDDVRMKGLLAHIPQGRQGQPQFIADAAMFIASDHAEYITGAILPVDGGWTCGGFARNF